MICMFRAIHCCKLMYSRTLQITVLKYMSWILQKKNSAPGLVWQAGFKMTKVKLDFSTDIDTLLMVKKGIMGGICHPVYKYAKANNKYIVLL